MQAVILAAGAGTRIGSPEGQRPKCLLEVGGRTLLQHQLAALQNVGIASVVVVVGYERAQIRELIGSSASYVVNERYAETNSLYSFMLAGPVVDDDVLVLNSDVLFHPKVLDLLLAGPANALVYDSDSGGDPEHMKVATANGRLLEMSKELPASRTKGENVGILRLSRAAAREAVTVAERLASAGHTRAWLASGINSTARRHRFRCIDIAGLPWIEIDFECDLERARREIWPAIAADAPAETAAAMNGGWRRRVRPMLRSTPRTNPAIPAA